MRSSSLTRILSIVVGLGLILAIANCIHDDSNAPPAPTKATPRDDVIASTPTFTTAWDGYIERKNDDNCSTPSCDWDDYDLIETCEGYHTNYLILRYWPASFCAQTNLLMDFDTRALPDASVIDDVTLQLYLENNTATPMSGQPDEQGCTLPGGYEAAISTLCGTFYKAMNITSGGDSIVDSWATAIPQYPCATSQLAGAHLWQSLGTESLPRWINLGVANKVSATKFSRYGIDKDFVSSQDLIELYFASGTNGPRLLVEYHVPFADYSDGGIQHSQSNCTSCSSSDFTISTAGTSCSVGRDLNYANLCNEAQMVMSFDTTELIDSHTISSATLAFYVNANVIEEDVSTRRVRVFAKNVSDPTIASSDFNRGGCASGYTDLGTVTLTSTGAKTLTIPNPNTNVNDGGYTKFVFVDDSSFSSSTGYVLYAIHRGNDSTVAKRPKLTVTYQ